MRNLNELECTKMITMNEETFDVKPTGIFHLHFTKL